MNVPKEIKYYYYIIIITKSPYISTFTIDFTPDIPRRFVDCTICYVFVDGVYLTHGYCHKPCHTSCIQTFLVSYCVLRPNLCVLKSPLGLVETPSLFGLSFVVLFRHPVFAAGGFDAGSGVACGLGAMFLADRRRGVTGGGFVTKLSTLIRAELGSFFGCSFVRFLVMGLL